MHTLGNDPYKEMLAKMKANSVLHDQEPVAPLAVADGRAAIAYVRAHAAEYGISPSRVGIMGFSAGGTIAAATAFGYTPENKNPDFVAPVYAYFPTEMQVNVPQEAPPRFLAAASADQSSISGVELYDTWIKTKHSAELHIFSKGGHGFGMKTQGLESDTWTDRFMEWMDQQGFIDPAFPRKRKNHQLNRRLILPKFLDYLTHNDWAVVSHYKDKNDSIIAHLNPNEKTGCIYWQLHNRRLG